VIAHADRPAQAAALDMAAVGWRPTVDNYLGRITKGRILQAIIGLMMVTAKAQLPPGEAIQLASSAELEGQG
jgi:ParB family chromosome partitioning protein